jgi:hypothetical protein
MTGIKCRAFSSSHDEVETWPFDHHLIIGWQHMNVILNIFTSSASETCSDARDDSLAIVALFCTIGLLASLCMAIWDPGLDLEISAGFY